MKRCIVFLIGLYRKFISPLKKPSCRFYPSCSKYAVEALEEYGVFKGSVLTARRLLKCHPFHPGGYDPVIKKEIK
jgi:putative membrane protein insertion efficiency factor